jgi:SpoVK/Ycf46/Vps4 family AAA+-type ATPase
MEGLAGDEDLLFVLTTNRPDLIEPALAARPGSTTCSKSARP